MPNDMANRGWRTVAQMGCITPETHACTCSSHVTRWLRRSDVHPQALGVNARRGCQNIRDQAGWRLHLRETLQPVAARLSFGEQRSAGANKSAMGLEAVELGPCQDAVEGVREQAVELADTAFRY